MLKRKHWSFILGSLVLLSMVLAGCGNTNTGNNAGGNQPKSGGSIVDGISQEPSSLMIAQSTQSFANLVDTAVWTPFLYTDDKGNYAPGALKEVPTQANGDIQVQNDASGTPKTESLTLRFRSGLKWSDGQPLTSADGAFAFKVFADPTYNDKQAFPASEISSVTTPDPLTMQVQLNTIDVAFLARAITGTIENAPLPQHVYASMAPADVAKAYPPTVTNGPFTVKEEVKGDHITVVKNPYFYLPGRPYLNQITFKLFPDANTEVTALQAGQIDTAYFLPVTSISTLKNIPGYKFYTPKNSVNWEALYFNLTNPILSDVTVREAIAAGFDVKSEISDIQKGNAVPTCDDGIGTWAADPNLIQNGAYCAYGPDQIVGYQPTKAGQLLDGDGWTMGSDGYRHKAGKTLEFRESTTSGRQYRLDSEQLFQAAMKTLGVKIDIANYPSSVLFGPILSPTDSKYAHSNNQWDIAEFENNWGSPDPDSSSVWLSTQVPPAGGSNIMYYSNPQVDQWETQQLKTLDQTARVQLFHQIQAQVLKDVPTVYLYAPLDISEYKATLHNYAPISPSPSETWNVWDWWLS
jgi:peptide/nickel transport system substrate-binding protein